MFSYGQIEAVLCRIHSIPKERMGALRGRLKHFLRLGIVPSSPGKGRKIAYSLENLYMWAICLELEEFGLDPVRIKEFLRLAYYPQIISMLIHGKGLSGEKAKNYFVFHPNFVSAWDEETLWTAMGGFVDDLSEIDRGEGPVFERLRRRSAAINIAKLRGLVQNALAA
jgi:hypothetical protein